MNIFCPLRRSDVPNIISLLRMLLVAPVVWLLMKGYDGAALLVFAVAGITDALDGYLAKRFGWSSRLGSILDPLADKLLLIAAYLTLGWMGQIPTWLVMVVIGRDIVIVTGGVIYHCLIGRFDLAPSRLSKLNTLAQIVLILAVLLIHSLPLMSHLITSMLVYGVMLTTVLSGLGYVWIWGTRALRAGAQDGVNQPSAKQ